MTTTATAGLAIECSPATVADVREFLATLDTFGLPDTALLEGYVAYTIERSPTTIADVREFLATLQAFGLPDSAILEGYVAYTSQSTPAPGENQTAVLPLDVVEVE